MMTIFDNYQWDLNYTNPTVLVKMLDVILSLANAGVDVFRMGAVTSVWKKVDTSCQNLTEAIVTPQEIIKYFEIQRYGAKERYRL